MAHVDWLKKIKKNLSFKVSHQNHIHHTKAINLILLDHEHYNKELNNELLCLTEAIINTNEIGIIGFEGYPNKVDRYRGESIQKYTNSTSDIRVTNPVGDDTAFAKACFHLQTLCVGVDSYGYCVEIDLECVTPSAVKAHPNQEKRSAHFMKSLIAERNSSGVKTDMILHAGSAHMDHIWYVLMHHMRKVPLGRNSCNLIRIRTQSHCDFPL